MRSPHISQSLKTAFGLHVLAFTGTLLLFSLPTTSAAQITTSITADATLNTIVTPIGSTVHEITGGTRPGQGPNLFHSFGQFSIGNGDIASFKGPSGIENILSRVTGGELSNIYGTIQSTIDGANLFLMNPAGVLFGPTASLDVSGSFHVTTADYLRLTDNVQFTAVPGPSDAVLTSSPVAAFGFLNDDVAGIDYDGSSESRSEFNVPGDDVLTLAVTDTQTLSLVGGDIQITGNFDPLLFNFDNTKIAAPGGHINVISVKSAGEVTFENTGLSLIAEGVSQLGDINLNSGALLETNGEKGGVVLIRAGNLVLETSDVFSDTNGGEDGASTGIDIEVTNTIILENAYVTTDTNGAGNAGDISLKTSNLQLIGTPDPDPTFTIPSATIASRSNPEATGSTGDITIMTDDLHIDGQAEITTTTFDEGKAGDIVVEANDVTILGTSTPLQNTGIFANTFGDGDAGLVTLVANNLTLTDQASIESLTRPLVSETGAAEGIEIALTENLTLQNGAFIAVNSEGSGPAGDMVVTAKNVIVEGTGEQEIFTGFDSSSVSIGDGGNITILSENLQVTEGGSIRASSTGIGNAGNIAVTAESTFSLTDSTISTRAENSSGGNIKITAGNLIQVTNGQITSDVQEGSAAAGSINVDPQFIVVQNGLIDTSADVGDGGDVTIIADTAILIDPFSTIDTSSQFGGSGTVDIRAPIQNLGETIAPLPEEILKVSGLFAARCAAQKGGKFSSFTNDSGVTPAPSSFLTSPLSFSAPVSEDTTTTAASRLGFDDIQRETKWRFSDTIHAVDLVQGCSLIPAFRS